MIKKSKILKTIIIYLIFSVTTLNIAPVFSADLNSITPEDIETAKELLNKDSETEKSPDLIVKTKPIAPVFEGLSEIEKTMAEDLMLEKPLEQFGYKTFNKVVSTFAPVADVPVGPDYIIGPGDSFTITLWGISEGIYKVSVSREGNITIPKAGVIHVAGLTFGDLRHYILAKLARYYESINLSVAMNNVRTISVYVLGEVQNPGAYTLSSLASAYSAIFAAGGPKKTGTMRNVFLKRNNRTIAKIDLYDFLLKGDRGGDKNLQSGDVIFVPLIGRVTGVIGNVKRPAIFEIGAGASLVNLIDLAGGVQTTATLNRVQIKRVIAHEKTVAMDRNLADVLKGEKFLVEDMDRIEIFPIYSEIENQVFLRGKVKYPGAYELKTKMKISDILPSRNLLLRESYLDRAEVVRLNDDKTKVSVQDFSLSELFNGDQKQDIELKPFDEIVVYTEARSIETISLRGQVKRPGTYTIMKGEKLASVLKRAGGFTDDAFIEGSVFTRKSVADLQQSRMDRLVDELEIKLTAVGPGDSERQQKNFAKVKDMISKMRQFKADGRVVIDINKDLDKFKGLSGNIALEDGDEINVPSTPSVVYVFGEVYNPSTMTYEKNKSVDYYLEKVGGPTKLAAKDSMFVVKADGTVFSNEQGHIGGKEIGPGDTILVPPQYEFFDSWKFSLDVVDLLYKSATAAALIKILLQ